MVSRHRISHQSRQGTNTVVNAWQESSRQTNASSHSWWSCGWTNKSSEIRHLFLLCPGVEPTVTDYGLGLTTMTQTNLLKLDRVQNEAMRVILGTTKDTCTPIETMRFILDLPPLQTTQKAEQVKAYFSDVGNHHNFTPRSRERHKGMQTGTG